MAPHPDDEALSLGGWVYDRAQAGDEVWVAFLTDGEGFTKALRARSNRPAFLFQYHDFQKLGRTRRNEANRSLDLLKIPKSHRYFLGYPTGGIMNLLKTPRPDMLFRSGATGLRYGIGEFEGRRMPVHPFSQASLVKDIDAVLRRARPELIVLPNPQDSNLDHRSSALLVLQECRKLSITPKIWGYFVHLGSRKDYPKPFGYHPDSGLETPPKISVILRYFPSKEARLAKEAALRAHKSQIQLRDGFLLSFIRREELYSDLSVLLSRP